MPLLLIQSRRHLLLVLLMELLFPSHRLFPLNSHALLLSENRNLLLRGDRRRQRYIASSTATLASGLGQAEVQKNQNTTKKRARNRPAPTPRSTAVFALLESSSPQKSMFAIRKLENDPEYLSLDRRDRAFARLMLATAERRQGQIDKVIAAFAAKPRNIKAMRTVDYFCDSVLRIGVAQLLFLDVPSHAALKETVDVLRMHPKIQVSKGQISFVNALLRRIDNDGAKALESTSVSDNVEPWLVKEWIDTYGKEITNAIIHASMDQSPIFISVNLRNCRDELEERAKLERIRQEMSTAEEAELLPTGSIRVPVQPLGSIRNWPLFNEGDWWIQDPSATLPAIVLGKALQQTKGILFRDMHVVDLCSAPGGKTAQLCSMGFGKVTAVELSENRSKTLKDNLTRLKMTDVCEVVVSNGKCWNPNSADTVHGVLVDAPCSATGVGSRRPDVLRRSPQLDELIAVQRELAVHAVDSLLKPGGTMVYATCSLLKQESEDQIRWLLARREGARVETNPIVPSEIPGFEDAIDENGWLRVIPGTLSGSQRFSDGFFVARLTRIS